MTSRPRNPLPWRTAGDDLSLYTVHEDDSCTLMDPADRSPLSDRRRGRHRRRHHDRRRDGRGGRRDGVQQRLQRLSRLRRRRRRRRRLRVLMRGVRLLESGLQIANVLDHPLDHLKLGKFSLARHIRHEGAQLRQVSGYLLGLEVAPGAADSQTVVQDAAMIGRHSATHGAHDHRLHGLAAVGQTSSQTDSRVDQFDALRFSFTLDAFLDANQTTRCVILSTRARTHTHAQTRARLFIDRQELSRNTEA